MTIIDIITKKREKQILSYAELEQMVMGFVNGTVPDYQMSAFLMAITLNGLTKQETFDLVDIMYKSGDHIDLTGIEAITIDKHSTGGVGDKTSIVLGPILASLNLCVAKMSGRGLGITGGTIDKLESIENFNTSLSESQFLKQAQEVGLVITGQTGHLVPADKKIYALRDVTATVDSIPLIASSIMSKKLASGASKIILDVKVGEGAFMKDIESARQLATLCVEIGQKYGRKTIACLTNMNEPLGYAIGNGLEIKECIDTLTGKGAPDFLELVETLASYALLLGHNLTLEEARKQVRDVLTNGQAYAKFLEFVTAQGGDVNHIKISPKTLSVKSKYTGYIQDIDTLALAKMVGHLGGSREQEGDILDLGVGIWLSKKKGDYVLEDEELLKVYFNDKNIAIDTILACFKIGPETAPTEPLIYEVIS